MSEEKENKAKFLTFFEAVDVIKKGGKVVKKGMKPGIYYLYRGPDDDPCIKDPSCFVHTIDGQLVRTPLPVPDDFDEKLFMEVK